MSKIIYFVRHGECQANVDGVVAGGGNDSPLTDRGRQQALEAADRLTGLEVDYFAASPLSRARDTGQLVMSRLGYNNELHLMGEFGERNVGDFTGLPLEEYFAKEKAGEESGEKVSEFRERVLKGLNHLQEANFSHALVFTHNGTVRMIRTILESRPAQDFAHLSQLKNGEYLEVDLDEVRLG